MSVLISCGGVGASRSSPAPTPQPGSPQPGGSGSGPTPGSTGGRFLYVGIVMNQGGVQGFRVDHQSGALAEVPGSPLLFGPPTDSFSQAGVLAAANSHVFLGFGPPNFASPVIRSYAVDPATGSLGNFTEVNAGAEAGDAQMRQLVIDPAKRNLYAVYQNSIASFQLNSDGSLTYLSTITGLATAFIFSLTIDPASNFAFLGVDNCPPKGNGCIGPPDILLLTRDASGALSNTNRLLKQNSVWSPGALAVDPSGKYLAAWIVTNTGVSQISIFSIDSSGGLTPAAGSPYSPPAGLNPTAFAFDTSGSFLYVLNSTDVSPQPESVTVYAISQQTGTLTQLQNETLPSGNFASGLNVDDSFAFVIDSQAGSVPSVIYVFKRDGNTGLLASPFALPDKPAGLQAGLGQAAELRF